MMKRRMFLLFQVSVAELLRAAQYNEIIEVNVWVYAYFKLAMSVMHC